jgi:hypothetical protein
LRGKERDEKGKLQPTGSKAFSATDISLEDLYERFMGVLEKQHLRRKKVSVSAAASGELAFYDSYSATLAKSSNYNILKVRYCALKVLVPRVPDSLQTLS